MGQAFAAKQNGRTHRLELFEYTGDGVVILSQEEREIAQFFADKRTKYNAAKGIRDQRQKQGAQNHGMEFACEIAACKLLNLYPDFQNGSFNVPDANYRNIPADVKCYNDQYHGISVRMNAAHASNPDHMMYLAMQNLPAKGHFQLLGWIQHYDMKKHADLKTGRDGVDYYLVPRRQFRTHHSTIILF